MHLSVLFNSKYQYEIKNDLLNAKSTQYRMRLVFKRILMGL